MTPPRSIGGMEWCGGHFSAKALGGLDQHVKLIQWMASILLKEVRGLKSSMHTAFHTRVYAIDFGFDLVLATLSRICVRIRNFDYQSRQFRLGTFPKSLGFVFFVFARCHCPSLSYVQSLLKNTIGFGLGVHQTSIFSEGLLAGP